LGGQVERKAELGKKNRMMNKIKKDKKEEVKEAEKVKVRQWKKEDKAGEKKAWL
jgi:hypothetical protein